VEAVHHCLLFLIIVCIFLYFAAANHVFKSSQAPYTMRSLIRSVFVLCILFNKYALAQTPILKDGRVDPILRMVEEKRPGLTIYPRTDGADRYVNMAVLEESTHKLKWFNCFGVAFDSVQLSSDERQLIISRDLDPFTFYRYLVYGNLSGVERAERQYRLYGARVLKDTTPEYRAVFNTPTVKAAQSTLQKILAIEGLLKKTCLQLRLFDSRSPRHVHETDSNRVQPALAGTMVKMADSTVYYNTYPLSPAARIVLRKQSPEKLYVFTGDGVLLDSVPLKQGKYASLLREKEDVFLLYRGWLEMRWQQLVAGQLESIEGLLAQDSILYTPSAWIRNSELQHTMNALREEQGLIERKINRLIIPEERDIEQLLADFYKKETSEISYLTGLGFAYTTIYVRGQKTYELSDHRDNVMAVISDRKKGTDVDNDGVIEYYNADIASMNDYYPFGMLQPGRNFSDRNKYRYGFNGKENDNEIKGEGNSLDFGDRMYDSRIGRWLSTDAKAGKYPGITPYAFGANNPVFYTDPDGKDVIPSNFKVVRYKDGSIRITGSVKITIQVINLSSMANNDIDLAGVATKMRTALTGYLYSSTTGDQPGFYTVEKGRRKQLSHSITSKVTYDITTDVSVTIANNMDEIKDRSHVLAIVDGFTSLKGESDNLGVAELGGRMSLMTVSDLNIANGSRRDEGLKTAVHEILHTLGANDRNREDKDIMNYEPNSSWDLHDEHVMEVWQSSLGYWAHIWEDIATKKDAQPYDYKTTSRSELAKYLKDHRVEPKTK